MKNMKNTVKAVLALAAIIGTVGVSQAQSVHPVPQDHPNQSEAGKARQVVRELPPRDVDRETRSNRSARLGRAERPDRGGVLNKGRGKDHNTTRSNRSARLGRAERPDRRGVLNKGRGKDHNTTRSNR